MKYLKYNILWLMWGVLIFVLISISSDNLPDNSLLKYIPQADKIIHAFLFGVFVVLLNNSFLKQYNNKKYRYYVIAIAIIIAAFYAGLTELLQKFIFLKRTAESMDFIADLVGIIIACLFYFKIKKF